MRTWKKKGRIEHQNSLEELKNTAQERTIGKKLQRGHRIVINGEKKLNVCPSPQVDGLRINDKIYILCQERNHKEQNFIFS